MCWTNRVEIRVTCDPSRQDLAKLADNGMPQKIREVLEGPALEVHGFGRGAGVLKGLRIPEERAPTLPGALRLEGFLKPLGMTQTN